MVAYNPEIKIIDNARDKMKSNYVKKRKEIMASDLSDSEKQEKLLELLCETKVIEGILQKVRSIDEIPEEYRESLGIIATPSQVVVDENIVNTLVEIYAKRAREIEESPLFISGEEQEIDTTAFEEELRKYFTVHYSDLLDTGYNNFLYDFAKQERGIMHEENGELVEIVKRCNIDPKKFNCFGNKLIVQDGLVAEEDRIFGIAKVYYATAKGINDRLSKLYNEIIYKTANMDHTIDNIRMLKNAYLKYAEEQDFEIEDEDVLEKIEVDNTKVEAIARYINRVLNEIEGVEPSDNTEVFAEEIARNYFKIMNFKYYDFYDLESVKAVVGEKAYPDELDELDLKIEENSITYLSVSRPDIVYGTPEYIKSQYESVMAKVKELHTTNAFTTGRELDIIGANGEKQALRRYIQENGIEGIDISIPQVEVNHDITNMIADALMEQYGARYEDKETMRARILSKLEANWSEIMTEQQCVYVNDLFKDELKEMGNKVAMEILYVKDDFVHLSDSQNIRSKCIYATPEALRRNIPEFDSEISRIAFCFREKRVRKVLKEYAQKQGIDLEIPDNDNDNEDAKKRAARRQKLEELDDELTSLQGKEEQAKRLCAQYEQKLPGKSHQET